MIADLKAKCNELYARGIELIESGGSIRDIRQSLLGVAELIAELAKVELSQKLVLEEKARLLLECATKLRLGVPIESIYLLLTRKPLPKREVPVISEGAEFDAFLQEVKATPVVKVEETSSEVAVAIPVVKVEETSSEVAVEKSEAESLRPLYLADYIGQDSVKEQLQESIQAARFRKEPLEHILLFGSAGLGKTTLSKIVANEMGSNLIVMSGPTIKDVNSFVQVIKDVKYGDIVFIDEIHRINQSAAEAIYTVMEDFELSYIFTKDRNNSENRLVKLPKFTIIGATTHSGLLEKPMRDRFFLQLKLELYTVPMLSSVVFTTAKKLGFSIDENAAIAIASRSRGVPRIANMFTKRVRDKAQVKGMCCINIAICEEFFAQSCIDDNGLTASDIAYLKALMDKFGGGPVGVDNIASVISEGRNIIENQYEPYLIFLGLIQITLSGRVLTENGQRYLCCEKSEEAIEKIATEIIDIEKGD